MTLQIPDEQDDHVLLRTAELKFPNPSAFIRMLIVKDEQTQKQNAYNTGNHIQPQPWPEDSHVDNT